MGVAGMIRWVNKMPLSIPMSKFLSISYGHTIGDVMGMPYEFSRRTNQGLDEYTHTIRTTVHTSRFQGRRETAMGQGSDDTEMAAVLMDALAANHFKYSRALAIENYLLFANKSSFVGKNTASLFKGITTIAGYEKRFILNNGGTQGNGHLMRAYPLLLCEDPYIAAEQDCSITNNSEICIAWTKCYLKLLTLVSSQNTNRYDSDSIAWQYRKYVIEMGEHMSTEMQQTFLSVISDIIPSEIRGETRGWSRHALHLAYFAAIFDFTSYKEGLHWIISLGGDTDTNGSVAGAVLGARFDLAKSTDPQELEMIRIVDNCDTSTGSYPRPPEMTFAHIRKIICSRLS